MGETSKPFAGSITSAIKAAVVAAIPAAVVEVGSGSPGHYELVVRSPVFRGQSMLESHRLVYAAIAPLMAGDAAPVHAIDKLRTLAD